MKLLGTAQAVLLLAFAFSARHERAEAAAQSPMASPESAAGSRLASYVLSDATLPAFLADQPEGALLNFHSSSCSHCKALAPEFEAAARELKEKGGAPLAFVDVSAAPKAAERYGIFRYPTMLWFRNGEQVLEVSPTVRQQAKITEYVDWASQPAVVSFEDRAELEEALPQLRGMLYDGAPPLVCGFGSSHVHDALERVAERLRGKTIFVFSWERREGDPPVRAFYQNSSADQDYLGKMDQDGLQSWVKLLVQKSKKQKK